MLDRDLVGAALPAYTLGAEIGRGGWGVVIQATHDALGRAVAIKQLPRAFASDERTRQRFIDEARIIGQLDHPHVVKVYDFIEHEGLWLIVMEHLGGGTLWDRFQDDGIRADAACAIALASCSGLAAAHEHDILHRDVKPENILFSDDGVLRVSDFGIAKAMGSSARHTLVGEIVGTPTYMAPEQALGEDLGPSSDVYSLGVVLYELLAGRLPFGEARTPTQQLVQHASDPPEPLTTAAPEVPPAIADVVMTSLEKRPPDRYASAQSFGVALARAATESFGSGWLANSGVDLMGGGKIHSAALRSATMGAPVRAPTLARPALRSDHFRPIVDEPVSPDDLAPAPESPPTPPPTAAPVVGEPAVEKPVVEEPVVEEPVVEEPAVEEPAVAGPPPGSPSVEPPAPRPDQVPTARTGGETLPPGQPSVAPPQPPADDSAAVAAMGAATAAGPTPTTLGHGGGDGSGARDRRRIIVVASVAVAVVIAGIIAVVLSSGGGDGADVAAGSDTTEDTAEPAGTTEPPPTTGTTVAPRECAPDARCAFIEDVALDGDSLVIDWTAAGFDPLIAEGRIHAHFFWGGIYEPRQAGTNASTFGVEQGAWELTDQQPFRSTGEMAWPNRPEGAEEICVTPATDAHAVVDPNQFDCVRIEWYLPIGP